MISWTMEYLPGSLDSQSLTQNCGTRLARYIYDGVSCSDEQCISVLSVCIQFPLKYTEHELRASMSVVLVNVTVGSMALSGRALDDLNTLTAPEAGLLPLLWRLWWVEEGESGGVTMPPEPMTPERASDKEEDGEGHQ